MCLVKKSIIRPPPSAVASVSTNVFFVLDSLTSILFLIEMGSCRFFLLKSMVCSGCSPGSTDTHLIAAYCSHFITYGYKSLRLSLSGSTFQWQFIVADISIRLIGADFLMHFHLLFDVANRRLVDTTTLASTAVMAVPADLALQINDAKDDYASLRFSFPAVFQPELHLLPRTPTDHGICHFIRTSGPPFSKFCRLAPDKLTAAKKVFKDVEAMGLCQKPRALCYPLYTSLPRKTVPYAPVVTTGA